MAGLQPTRQLYAYGEPNPLQQVPAWLRLSLPALLLADPSHVAVNIAAVFHP